MFLTSTVKQEPFSITESLVSIYEFVLESQEDIANSKFEIIQLEHESLLKKEQGYLSESEFLEAEEEVKEKGKGFLAKIVEFISGLYEKVSTFISGIYNKIKAKLLGTQAVQEPEGLIDKITKACSAIKAFADEVVKNPMENKAAVAVTTALAAFSAVGAYKAAVKGKDMLSKFEIINSTSKYVLGKIGELKNYAQQAANAGDAEKSNAMRKAAAAVYKGVGYLNRVFGLGMAKLRYATKGKEGNVGDVSPAKPTPERDDDQKGDKAPRQPAMESYNFLSEAE